MRYWLARSLSDLGSRVELEQAEYTDIKAAYQQLREMIGAEEKFSVLMENYVELEDTLLHEAIGHLAFQRSDLINLQALRNLLSRRILNVLASARLYLDALMRHSAAIPGPTCDLVKAIKDKRRALYNKSCAYRVMEALRNYTQHHELPVHLAGVNLSAEPDINSPENQRIAISIVAQLKIDHLAEDKKFKHEIITDLKSLGQKIPIMPLVREYVELLGEIHQEFRELTKSCDGKWAKIVQEMSQRYTTQFPSKSIVGLIVEALDDNNEPVDQVNVAAGPDEYHDYLKKITRPTRDLSKRYVKW